MLVPHLEYLTQAEQKPNDQCVEDVGLHDLQHVCGKYLASTTTSARGV